MATRGGRSSDGFRDSQGGCGRPKRVRTRAIVGALVIGLVVGFLAPGAVATSYTDEFETNPLSAEVVTSFSTGTAATGLSYTCSSTGDGCDFTWGAGSGDGGSLCIDVLSVLPENHGSTEKFTIVSRDGKAFVFNSVWMDVLLGDGVWIVGKGPEPFDIVVGTGSVGTYSPPGGSKLVTEVEFSSTHFAWDYIDTVSVELDVPGAGIYGGGYLIENGDPSPSTGDDTDFESTPVGTPVSKTFTISSIGDLDLDLTGATYVDFSSNPSGDFTVTTQPTVDPITAGGSETFTIEFNPSSSGDKTATVSIRNDSEADPYTFAIEGTGAGAPEIDVEGNGTSIPDGDVTSELGDHTNFGQVSIGSSFDRTFTIQNEGNATLTLTDHPSAVSLSGSSDFSVFTQPGIGSVAPSGSTTFVIRCAPTATGYQVAYVSIANSDADEDPYNFEISCTGLDTTKPEVTINQAGGQADPTNGSTINFTVVFSEPVNDFATGDVTLSGAAGATTATVTGGGMTYNVAVNGMTGDGSVTATVAAGVAQDAAGNTNNASTTTDNTVTYDTTGPTVTIDQAGGQADPTNGSTINFTVVFSEPVNDFATGDVTLSGAAGATTATVTGGGMTYNVAVNGMTGDGSVTATVAAGVAQDAAGNTNNASTTTDNTVTYDTTGPTVTIDQAGGQADPTNGSTINFTVVFSEAVTDFATGDVTLSGAAGATTATVTGGGMTYNVAVNGMTGDGSVTATVAAGVAQDAAGNTNNASTTTDNTVTYDTTGPTVTIDQAGGQADPTNGSTINFTVVFSEAVTDFATGDVTLSGAAGATTATVTGGGMTYNVAVNGMTGDGSVTATVAAGVAQDAAGNTNNASTTTDNTVTYDNTPPTDPTPRSSSHDVNVWDNDVSVVIDFLVSASDGGSGVDGFEIEWDQSGTWAPTPAKEKEETWSGDTFTATADGDWYFHIATVDNAGNWTSTVHFGPFLIDTTSPSKPTGLSPADDTITNADPLRLEWDPCSDTGGSGMRSTATYRVQVDSVPVAKDYYTANTYYEPELDEGTYHWYLYSRDNAGNVSLDSATLTVTIDRTAPDVTIDQPAGQADPTNGSPVEFTAVFGEPIDDDTFEDVDITFVGTATTGAVTITEILPLNGTTFSVSVVVTGDGTVIPTLPAGGVDDPAGNTNTLSTSTDNTVTYDGTPPSVSGVAENLSVIAEADAGDKKFTLTIEYDETMDIGVAPTVSFPTSGEDPTGTITLDTELVGGSGWSSDSKTYVARYDGADANAEIDLIDVRVTGAQDLAGNVQPQYDEADVFSIDTVQPTVSSLTENLSMIAEANEGDQTFTLTVVYDEPMNIGVAPTVSFPVEDPTGTITLDTEPDGSGWSGSTTYVALYNVADADEEIDLIDVRVTGGKDAAGNTQVQYDETDVFSVDTKKPAVPAAVGSVTVNTNPVYEGNLTQQVTVTFTEAMDTSATPAIAFSHETTWTEDVGSRLWSALDTVFTVTYTLTDLDEEHYDRTPGIDVVTIDVTGAKDAAGNDQENYAPQAEFDIDTLQPTLIDATSSTPDGCYIAGAGINVTLTFSEDVRFDLPIGELELVLDVGGARAATYHVSIFFIDFLVLTDTASGTYVVAADENSCDLTLLSYTTSNPDTLVDWAGNVIDYAGPPAGSNIADHKAIVVDTTLPVAIEDPNGDEDRSASDDTKTIDVRSDPYGRHRLTIRENTPAYIDVKFNDSDLPCTVQLGILDIPQPPENGSAWFDDPATNIRYAPDHDYLGPDSFTYRIYDACGNVSGEATVYVEVLPQIVMDDQYLTICQNESVKFDISAADLFVPEHDFTFSILAGPTHGVVVGDLADVTYTPHGPTTAELEFSTITLTYTPALGFVGFDNIRVAVAEPFGGRGVVEVDIIVGECEPGVGEVASIELGHGMVLPIIVPVTFEVVAETTPDALILMSREDGLVYPGALSILWSEEINRYVLLLDSGPLPLGAYWLMIPLGNGDRVELIIEVGEAE